MTDTRSPQSASALASRAKQRADSLVPFQLSVEDEEALVRQVTGQILHWDLSAKSPETLLGDVSKTVTSTLLLVTHKREAGEFKKLCARHSADSITLRDFIYSPLFEKPARLNMARAARKSGGESNRKVTPMEMALAQSLYKASWQQLAKLMILGVLHHRSRDLQGLELPPGRQIYSAGAELLAGVPMPQPVVIEPLAEPDPDLAPTTKAAAWELLKRYKFKEGHIDAYIDNRPVRKALKLLKELKNE